MKMQNITLSPIITEKAMRGDHEGRYCFRVEAYTSKTDIKNIIEKKFKVKVSGIRALINKGGRRRIGQKRVEIILPSWKKIYIKLQKGQKISLFEPGGEAESKS